MGDERLTSRDRERADSVDDLLPLPMFPLSSVLFPFMGIPLHVFELRYRRLVSDLSSLPPYFGVVLITRGSEVGGGDTRSDVGTLARVSEKVELADGRWVVLAVGETKIKVRSWLPDDPYPMALVERIADEQWVPQPADYGRSLEKKLRYSLLLRDEISLTSNVSPNIGVSSRRDEALWQMCALAPISVIDQQSLLEAGSGTVRAALLDQLLTETISVLESQLSL